MPSHELEKPNSFTTPPSEPSPKHRHPWLGIVAGILVVLAAIAAVAISTGFVPLSTAASAAPKGPKYHCPMHPTVVSDKPGACPICGMDLVPIGEGGHADHDAPKSGVPGLAVVSITPQARQVMGLKLGTVEKRHLAREIRTSARIVADETRLWRVTTKNDGWVEKLFVAYAGQEVKKGDPLLTIYSPALVSAQTEYLMALRARGNVKPGNEADAANGSGSLVSSARRRLELWDITADQIEQLSRTGKVEKFLTLYAPASGVVMARDVLAGQKIMSGDSLMVIADLSVIWGDADIYQSDLPYVKVGMPLEISFPYWPGKIFNGKVIFVSPTLDGESRTLSARLEIPNPELLLKPNMYGDARLMYEVGEKLSIPASAVMLGGQRTYAFRDVGDGHLVPSEIKLGVRSEDHYELLGGLNEGDKVVVSANFLVDSESNLKSALEALNTGTPAAEPASGHQHQGEVAKSEASQPEEIAADQYEKVLSGYLTIQEALAVDNFPKARDTARSLVDAKLTAAKQIADAPGLAEARKGFQTLSTTMIAAAHKLGAPANQKLYRLFCSMALDNKGGDWLQRTAETSNPYFGTEMSKCGEIKEEIAATGQVH